MSGLRYKTDAKSKTNSLLFVRRPHFVSRKAKARTLKVTSDSENQHIIFTIENG
jgi:hypothetical protein